MFIFVFMVTTLISLYFTKQLISWLKQRSIVAIPDYRSSHERSTPVGGGLIISALAIVAFVMFLWPLNGHELGTLVGFAVLMFISWWDDNHSVAPFLRLAVHILAVTLALGTLPEQNHVLSAALPLWFDRLFTGLCWLWFINLYNFMDGIDGMAGSETLSICLGVTVVGSLVGLPGDYQLLATAISGATAGFLWWNWSPAKIFLGDVGSIPLGFFLGLLLIKLAMAGHLAAAIILPLYYLMDSTLTLIQRLRQGKKIWHPHRTHFYQQAARGLPSHASVVERVIIANLALLLAAMLALSYPTPALILAFLTVIALLLHFKAVSSHKS